MNNGSGDDLLRRARTGDEKARGLLCEHLSPRVVDSLRRRAGPAARRWLDLESIALTVLLEALESVMGEPAATFEDLRRRAHKRAYWRMLDGLEKHRHYQGGSAVGEGLKPTAQPSTAGPVTRRDDLCRMRDLVDKLPTKYAEAVQLHVYEDLEFREMAQRLGIGLDAARRRYERGRDELIRRVAGSDWGTP